MDRGKQIARLAVAAIIVIAASACGSSTSPTEPTPQVPGPVAQTPQPPPPAPTPNPPAPNPPAPPTSPAPPPPTTPAPPSVESYTADVVDVFWYEGKGGPLWTGSTVMVEIDGPIVWVGTTRLNLIYRDADSVRAELQEPGGRSIAFDLRLDRRSWALSGSVGVASGTIR
jgi:hypothetical protein